MKNYSTAAEVFADLFSTSPARRNDAYQAFRAGDGMYPVMERVRAALTFGGVRYVAVQKRTKSGAWSKRYRTLTLDEYVDEFRGCGIDADGLERIRSKYAA